MKEVLSGIEYIYIYPPVGDARVAKSSMIEVLFDKISGSFATAGPIWVYQYEYEEEFEELTSSTMAQESQPLNSTTVILSPNPFTQTLSLKFHNQPGHKLNIRIYDISGRLVKNLYEGKTNEIFSLNWNGEDENGKKVSAGIYFLQVKDSDTGLSIVHKVVKVE